MPAHEVRFSIVVTCFFEIRSSTEMPPKTKRKLQLEAARARKVAKLDESSERRDEGSRETASERREEARRKSGIERRDESSVSGMRGEPSTCTRKWNEK